MLEGCHIREHDGEITQRKMKTSCSERGTRPIEKQQSHFVTFIFNARGA